MTIERKHTQQLPLFTGICSSRNYRAMYRAACNFHEKHNPRNWEGLVFGANSDNEPDCTYFGAAVEEMEQIIRNFQNDPFLSALLLAIYEEMEREYHLMERMNKHESGIYTGDHQADAQMQ